MSKTINDQLIISSIVIITTILLILSLSGIKYSRAQTYEKVISFPDVTITNSNNKNYTLDEESILVTNNNESSNRKPVEVLNPDFGLNPPFVTLNKGQEYTVNPPNEDDIKYNNVTVKLAQVLFIAPGIEIQDADPEDPDTMTLGGQIGIAQFGGGKGGSFIIPHNVTPVNYILYVYIQYPNGTTGVFSNIIMVG